MLMKVAHIYVLTVSTAGKELAQIMDFVAVKMPFDEVERFRKL